ncbi:glutamine-hydrolyzing carbamoyl-phosphate synthase small subunit [bacterium]|nr:MAG: glutamine-hydrolyzing carbamoyl-phosphate synthase small subunit [bacterium]
MKARLVLEDGKTYDCFSFGAEGETTGEIVFNTSMTGYQEILSDPSYCGQMIVMTYPLIGNYGICEEDFESDKPQVKAFIVKELCTYPSNWRSGTSLDSLLKSHNIMGVEGLDTRAITRHIRNSGAMRAIISTKDLDVPGLLEKVKRSPSMMGANLVDEVTCKKAYTWNEPNGRDWQFLENVTKENKYTIAVYDFGVKRNILRKLVERGCKLHVFPSKTKAEEILKINPDGVFLSNGPGDPEAVDYVIPEIKKLIGKKPIFGICLGQQLAGIALGAHTYKLKFGHRGANHPVKNLETGVIEITSQNHGFTVDPKSLNEREIELTHFNLYDGTLEGFRHKELPIFSVQYHPEASPGPHDSDYLFNKFMDSIEDFA